MSAQPKEIENVNLDAARAKAEKVFDEGVALCLKGMTGLGTNLFKVMLDKGMKRTTVKDSKGEERRRLVYDPDAAAAAADAWFAAESRKRFKAFKRYEELMHEMCDQGTNFTYNLDHRPLTLYDVVDDRAVSAIDRLNKIAAKREIDVDAANKRRAAS
jgi:hypothetical protein